MDQMEVIFQSLIETLDPVLIAWVFFGVMVGIIFGALPGLSATTGIAVFTPMTFGLEATLSIGFLLGLFCGGLWAGSIPAILIRTPGAPGNAATTLDGYPMAQQGRAGYAIFLSITTSFIGGVFSALVLLFFAPPIAKAALKFGPAEYCAVALFGLSCISALSGKEILKGIITGLIGMLLGSIGMDPIDGVVRLTFGNLNMMTGIKIIPAMVGLFAISEAFRNAEDLENIGRSRISSSDLNIKYSDYPKFAKVLLKNKLLMLKSAIIGTIVGAIPGTGASTASWISYNEAVRSSKDSDSFGTGDERGIIASETANNAISGGALIPLLTLGIPGDTATAVLLGALTIQGITPGAKLVSQNYGLIATILWILILGNIFMMLLGLFGCKYFPKILNISQRILIPIVLILCVAGSFASANSFFDVKIAFLLGIVGWLFMKLNYPVTPMILGVILGPIFEPNLRRALVATKGDWTIFFTRPISLVFILLSIITIVLSVRRAKRSSSKE